MFPIVFTSNITLSVSLVSLIYKIYVPTLDIQHSIQHNLLYCVCRNSRKTHIVLHFTFFFTSSLKPFNQWLAKRSVFGIFGIAMLPLRPSDTWESAGCLDVDPLSHHSILWCPILILYSEIYGLWCSLSRLIGLIVIKLISLLFGIISILPLGFPWTQRNLILYMFSQDSGSFGCTWGCTY